MDVNSHDLQKSESHLHNGASNVGCSGSNSCHGSTHKINATYEFAEPFEFSLIEKVQGGSNYPSNYYDYVRTEGEIHVRPATEHLDTNLRVHITIHGSNPELMHLNSLEKTDSTLVIETLNHIKRDFSRSKPSIYINATIFVALGTVLQNFDIDTQSLAIIFHPDLDYTVKDSTTLSTISRPIRMPTGLSFILPPAPLLERNPFTTSSPLLPFQARSPSPTFRRLLQTCIRSRLPYSLVQAQRPYAPQPLLFTRASPFQIGTTKMMSAPLPDPSPLPFSTPPKQAFAPPRARYLPPSTHMAVSLLHLSSLPTAHPAAPPSPSTILSRTHRPRCELSALHITLFRAR